MVAPDGVVMRDGAARGEQRLAGGGLDLGPLLDLAAAPAGREHGVVGRRAVGIDVREAARHAAAPTHAGDGVARRLHHLGMELLEAVPGDGRLEGLGDHGGAHQHVAQVGSVQEGVAPGAGGAFAGAFLAAARRAGPLRHPAAAVAAELERARHRGIGRVIGGLEAEHQQGGVAAAGAGVRRLQRDRAAGSSRGAGPTARARAPPAAARAKPSAPGKRDARRGPEAGPLLEPHPGFDDDPERSLGADPEAIRARPRARAGQAARLDDPRRCHHAQRFHELVDVGVQRRVVPARAGGDPAAQARELEGLREVAQREPVGPELALERGAEDAGLDARRARDARRSRARGRAFCRSIETAPRRSPESARLDAAHHARAAAVRDRRQTLLRAPVEQPHQVGFGAREGDLVGRVRELAARAAHDVAVRLSVAVGGAVVGLRPRAARRARTGAAHAGRRQRDPIQARRGRDAQLAAARSARRACGRCRPPAPRSAPLPRAPSPRSCGARPPPSASALCGGRAVTARPASEARCEPAEAEARLCPRRIRSRARAPRARAGPGRACRPAGRAGCRRDPRRRRDGPGSAPRSPSHRPRRRSRPPAGRCRRPRSPRR